MYQIYVTVCGKNFIFTTKGHFSSRQANISVHVTTTSLFARHWRFCSLINDTSVYQIMIFLLT